MVATTMITAMAHKETAKQASLKRLRAAEATNVAMPASVDIDSDDAEAALAELLTAGTVREGRSGLYYLDESQAKESRPGQPFIALLAVLIAVSFAASLITLAARAG